MPFYIDGDSVRSDKIVDIINSNINAKLVGDNDVKITYIQATYDNITISDILLLLNDNYSFVIYKSPGFYKYNNTIMQITMINNSLKINIYSGDHFHEANKLLVKINELCNFKTIDSVKISMSMDCVEYFDLNTLQIDINELTIDSQSLDFSTKATKVANMINNYKFKIYHIKIGSRTDSLYNHPRKHNYTRFITNQIKKIFYYDIKVTSFEEEMKGLLNVSKININYGLLIHNNINLNEDDKKQLYNRILCYV